MASVVDPGYLSVDEVARLSGKSAGYVRRLARDGEIEARREGRRWLVAASAIAVLRDGVDEPDAASWDLERQLLYAERAELNEKLLRQRIDVLEADNARLVDENRRLRAAVATLVGTQQSVDR